MGIGGSIFLIAVGAIIAFGVRDQTLGPLDLNVIGWVLMLAGLAGLLITLWVWNSRKRRVVATGPTHQHVDRQVVQSPPPGVVDEGNWAQSPPERRV
jgi:Domain of unknown function (DUF6458)